MRNDLLKRCLHGRTQDVYIGREVFEIGVFSAVIIFNEDYTGLKLTHLGHFNAQLC